MRSSAPVLLVLAALIAGCAPAPSPTTLATGSPTAQASPTATPSTAPTSVPTPSPTASPTPSPTPTPSLVATPSPSLVPTTVELPAFTTATAPSAGTAWSGITWRKLKSSDAFGKVRSVVRWRGGFVALGGVIATGDTSRTPMWVSTDGAAWHPLASSVFGPATIVVGVGQTKTGLVALTLQGGKNQCDGEATPLSCWSPTPPFLAWTSTDGSTWSSHPGPAIDLPSECDGCGVAVPNLVAGTPGLLVVNRNGGTARIDALAAFSSDGITWKNLPATALPSGFAFGDVEAFESGFLAVGDNGGGPGKAMALWSSDGRHWVTHYLPTSGLPRGAGSTANGMAVGPKGVIVTGSDQLAPGTVFWWTSTTGRAWLRFLGYPPVGTWIGQGEGSGMIPNGTLVGSGERLLAYRSGTKPVAWTSLDGRSWRRISVTGPVVKGSGALVLLPIGIMWVGDDGSAWFGQPTT